MRVEGFIEVGTIGGRGAEVWVVVLWGEVEVLVEEGGVDVVGVAEVEGGREVLVGEVEAVTVTMGEMTIRVVDAATPIF